MDEGIFEGPPKFRQAIEDWMVELYAGHILAWTEEMLAKEREIGKSGDDPFEAGIKQNQELLSSIERDVDRLKKPGQVAKWVVAYPVYSGVFPKVLAVRMAKWTIQTAGLGDEEQAYELGQSKIGKDRVSFGGSSARFRYGYRKREVVERVLSMIQQANDALPEARKRAEKNKDWDKTSQLNDDGKPNMATIVDLELIRRAASKIAKKAKKYATSASSQFKIDASDWKYIDSGIDDELAKKLENAWGDVKVSLHFKSHGSRGGAWMWKTISNRFTGQILKIERELQVDVRNPIAYSLDDFNEGLNEIRRVVRHEVQHAGQDFLSQLKSIGGTGAAKSAGLPGKDIRSSSVSQRVAGMMGAQGHALLDQEFYTDLADSVDRFMRVYKKVSKRMLPIFIRVFTAAYGAQKPGMKLLDDIKEVGASSDEAKGMVTGKHWVPDWPFASWFTHDKEKWKKAVSEFIKEIQNRGVQLPGRFAMEGVRIRKERLLEARFKYPVVNISGFAGGWDERALRRAKISWSYPNLVDLGAFDYEDDAVKAAEKWVKDFEKKNHPGGEAQVVALQRYPDHENENEDGPLWVPVVSYHFSFS